MAYRLMLAKSALRGYLLCYRIEATVMKSNVTEFFRDTRAMMKAVVDVNRTSMKAVKFLINLCAEYMRTGEENETINTYFAKRQCAVTHESDIDPQLDECFAFISAGLENFEQRGSNWIFFRIVRLDIHISKFEPLRAGWISKMPKWIISKRAVVNIEETGDGQCFKWAVLGALYPPQKSDGGSGYFHKARITNYLPYEAELRFDGIEFPVRICDIPKFERMNDISVHLYGAEEAAHSLYPIYLARERRARHVSLVLYEEHYGSVTGLDRLLHKQQSKHKSAGHYCEMCLFWFGDKQRLAEHRPYCSNADGGTKVARIRMPEVGNNTLKFSHVRKMIRRPLVIYADFECILETVPQPNPAPNTVKTQLHVPCAFGAVATRSCCGNEVKYGNYKKYIGDDCVERFLQFVINVADRAKANLNKHKEPRLTDAETAFHGLQLLCWMCKESLNGDSVPDHCHVCGKYRGPAHADCNLSAKLCTDIQVVFHNLRRYDGHLLMQKMGIIAERYKLRISCIPKADEDYISFSLLRHNVPNASRKRNHNGQIRKDKSWKITFVDSCQFLPASLDALVGNLPPNGFAPLESGFAGEDVSLLKRKGLFPYGYLDSWQKLKVSNPPSKADFHNDLANADISDSEYEHVLNVWKSFKVQNLQEYMEIYLKCDVLLLCAVFEDFRAFSMQNFELDPSHYFTLPGLAWDACLKYTQVKLEQLTDPDMYAFFESGIRGGSVNVSKRYSKANNPYLVGYDPAEPTSYIFYADANNLYGWAMEQMLPVSEFAWLSDTEIEALDVSKLPEDGDYGCVLEVDLEYPRALHDEHNCFPLAPERMKVTSDMLSPYARELLGNEKHAQSEKLVSSLNNKERYVVHYRNLKYYMEKGLKLTKIHRGVRFRQAAWMVPYIRFNTEKRKAAKTVVAKNHYKLFNNAVFGKGMENVRKYVQVELVTSPARFKKLTKREQYDRATIFSENLVACRMRNKNVELNKAIYSGLTVLELSKLHMVRHYYDVLKPEYGSRIQLLMTDTDSFLLEIQTEDFYEDMLAHKDVYDTASYPKEHLLYSAQNDKVVGKFKDETSGAPPEEFVGLRPKSYSLKVGEEEHKRSKGVSRTVVSKELRHADFVDILRGKTYRYDQMRYIRSYLHEMYTVNIRKKSLASFDDKRYLLPDGVHTLAYGHYLIQEEDERAAAAAADPGTST